MSPLLARAVPLLNKLIPSSLAVKGLSKINPKLATFVTDSLAAGYTADNVLDYLRNRLTSSGEQMEKQRLEGASSLTPQERNILHKRNQEAGAGKLAATAIGLGTGLSGLARDEEQDQSMQTQGAQSPQMLQRQQPPAFSQQPPALPQKPQTPSNRNSAEFNALNQPQQSIHPLQAFEMNYPVLAQGLFDTIQQGVGPGEAAKILKNSTALGSQVKQVEKDTGRKFVDYVAELFRGNQQPEQGRQPHPNSARGKQLARQQPQQMNNQEPLAMTQEMYDQHQANYNQQQQRQSQAGPQGGNIDQEIMAALDKILKM